MLVAFFLEPDCPPPISIGSIPECGKLVTGRKSILGLLLALGLFCGTAFLWPRISNGEHAIAHSLKTALGVYRDRYGQNPKDLTSVEPILSEVTQATSTIFRISDDVFNVRIATPRRVFELSVEYRTSAAGGLERFHVYNVRDHIPTN